MKKILMILTVSAMLMLVGCKREAGVGQADTYPTQWQDIHIICVEGYKFIVLKNHWYGGGIDQVWELGPDGPRPLVCKEKN